MKIKNLTQMSNFPIMHKIAFLKLYGLTIDIFAAPVNVAISQISSKINIITLVPYIIRVLFGPLHRSTIIATILVINIDSRPIFSLKSQSAFSSQSPQISASQGWNNFFLLLCKNCNDPHPQLANRRHIQLVE